MAKTFNARYWEALFVIAGALLVSFTFIVRAQSTNTSDQIQVSASGNSGGIQGITFPIPELGNCASKDECHSYCNDTTHMDACVAFAEAHGLMNKDDVSNAEKFKQALQSGGGPGGCTNPRDCEAFCSDSTNIEACVNFAKSHGIKDTNVDQGEKILAHLKGGGHMPGDCTTKESCEAYCNNFSHYQECFNWSKATGVGPAAGGPQGNGQGIANGGEPTSDQLQKLSDLAKNGQTPGGCTSKDTCETYCKDASHRDECVAFGVKAGFISADEADKIKQTNGAGPGGCNSQDACNAYCNDPTHQAECFKFAQDQGFLNKNDQQQIQNGIVQVRSGLTQAPPEVVACIKSSIDPSTFDQIESGKLVPGPDVGNQMRACFDKFGHTENPGQIFSHLPDQVLTCVKSKLGSDFDKIQSGAEMPTPQMADTIRVCFQSTQMQGGQGNGSPTQNGGPNQQNGSGGNFQNFLQTAPPEITTCLQQALGADFEALKSGVMPTDPSVYQKVQPCFNNFRPQNTNNGPGGPGQQGGPGGSGFQGGMGYPATSTNGYNNPNPPTAIICPPGQYSNGRSCETTVVCPNGGEYWNGTSCHYISTGEADCGPSKDCFRYCLDVLHRTLVQCDTLNHPCPDGQTWSNPGSNAGGCVTIPNNNPPTCALGQYWNGSSCVTTANTNTPTCPPGQYLNGTICQSQPPPVYNTNTNPPPPTPPASCPTGQNWNGTSCEASPTYCPSGQYWNGSSCQTQISPTPPPPSTTTCPSGQYLSGTSCQCPSGQYWIGSSCMTGDPATMCTQHGGTWTGTTCQMPSCPTGQYWNGTSCFTPTGDPATVCKQYGGTWTGTTCQMPFGNTTTSTSLISTLNSLASILQTLSRLLIR